MTDFIANGKTYTLEDFFGYKLYEYITAGTGEFLPRWIAAHKDLIADSQNSSVATSTSSVAIGTGTKTFVLSSVLPLFAGMRVLVVDTANAANYMYGTITAWDSSTKTVTLSVASGETGGSGTIASWNFSGKVGRTGATGAAGSNGSNGADGQIGKQTISIPAGAMYPRNSNGCAPLATIAGESGQPDSKTLDFDKDAVEYAEFIVPMPKGWNASTLTYQVIWSHPSTSTNFNVAFDLQAVALADDDALATNFGTAVQVNDTGGTTSDIYFTPESGSVTVGNTPSKGDLVCFRLSRVATDATNDTLAVDARVHGVKLYYTTDAANDT